MEYPVDINNAATDAKHPANKRNEARAKLDSIGIVAIGERIAECVTYRTIAADAGVSVGSLCAWLARPEYAEHYARAREARADFLAEEILAIADDGSDDSYTDANGTKRTDHDAVTRAKLRVDTRKWIASKLWPTKYGDKLDVQNTHTVSPLAEAFKRLVDQGSAITVGSGSTFDQKTEEDEA